MFWANSGPIRQTRPKVENLVDARLTKIRGPWKPVWDGQTLDIEKRLGHATCTSIVFYQYSALFGFKIKVSESKSAEYHFSVFLEITPCQLSNKYSIENV